MGRFQELSTEIAGLGDSMIGTLSFNGNFSEA